MKHTKTILKGIGFIFSIIVATIYAPAQKVASTKTKDYSYYYQIDPNPQNLSFPEQGKVKFWDFAALKAVYTNRMEITEVKSKILPKQFIGINDKLKSFYVLKHDLLYKNGFSNLDPIKIGGLIDAKYLNPLQESFKNLTYGSKVIEKTAYEVIYPLDNINREIFDYLPMMPDSLSVNVVISRQNVVDGKGESLYLPKETYTDVYRLTQSDRLEYTFKMKVGSSNWIDITQSILSSNIEIPFVRNRVIFFNKLQTWPLLVLDLNDKGDQINFAQIFISNKVALKSQMQPLTPDVVVMPNPVYSSEIRVDFTSFTPGKYFFMIYSLLGKLEKNVPYYIPGNRSILLDISDLNPGIYIYSVLNTNGKIIQSKRMSIMRP